jgi:hypothetical protein
MKTMDVIDFIVDGSDLIGQTVTVTGCKFAAASESSVLCSAGSPGSVIIDGRTLNREDLRRALRTCSGFMTPPNCMGSVTGTVDKGAFGLRLTKAALGWRPSS